MRAALFSVVDDVFDLRMQQLRYLVTPSWYATPYLKVCVKHCGDDLVVELRVVQLQGFLESPHVMRECQAFVPVARVTWMR